MTLAKRMDKDYIGRHLLQSGEITENQLEDALAEQKLNEEQGKKKLLGQILVEMGYCTEESITRAVATKAGVPYLSLNSITLDEAALSLVTPEIARRYQALPLFFEDNRLVVAMKYPTDIIAIDDLRILTGHDIKPVFVSDTELKSAQERFSIQELNVEQTSEEEEYAEDVLTTDDSIQKPAVQLTNRLINQSVRSEASDVHIEPLEKSSRVRFRIDGVLHDMMHPSRQLHPSLVTRIKVMASMDIAERRIPQDGRITMKVEDKTIDVRVASLPTAYGEKLTMRLLDRGARLISLEDLGFPGKNLLSYRRIMKLPYGFILVTGPTGSGKSTTLYATLLELNSVEKHIITLEDPIERRLDGINQVQVNLRAGMTFASGLRSILRNDPDIVMVGEIRDHETARISVESALTGHLVLSTLHTNDAAGAVTRLGDMGIEPYLTASSLVGVVAQRLMRVLCTNCKTAETLSREEILYSVPDFPLHVGEEAVTLYRPVGCMRCNNTGYKGRLGVYELLLVSDNLQRLILNRSSTNEIKAAAVEEGMITLRQDGLQKVKEGHTSLEELLRVVV